MSLLNSSLPDLTEEYDQIRNRIGHNSEKPLNNPLLNKNLEVEKKSATLYSSKRDSQRPRKAETRFLLSFLPFPPSAVLNLNENKGRIEAQPHNQERGEKTNTSNVSISLYSVARRKIKTYRVLLEERLKSAVRTARTEATKVTHEAIQVLKIMIFLRSAKDLPSVLKLYGIEDPLKD
jgi:hypothetical protein